jgi:hypothetical protein
MFTHIFADFEHHMRNWKEHVLDQLRRATLHSTQHDARTPPPSALGTFHWADINFGGTTAPIASRTLPYERRRQRIMESRRFTNFSHLPIVRRYQARLAATDEQHLDEWIETTGWEC